MGSISSSLAVRAESSQAYTVHLPEPGSELPLLLDSPHSGTVFPPTFSTLASEAELLTAWDAWIPELWSGSVAVGATLLEADFPRVVIDPNRAESDIDPAVLSATWPPEWGEISPTAYSSRGMGLIRRFILPGRPMYTEPLSPAQVNDRITNLYLPYHRALSDRLDTLRSKYGTVWHINCHSMKSIGNAMNIDSGTRRADMVVGDRDGTSCAAEFTDLVVNGLKAFGYDVALNAPYKGGDIVRRYGNPVRQQHSIQIEINRALYMDEAKFEKSTGFSTLQKNLGSLSGLLAGYIKESLSTSQA